MLGITQGIKWKDYIDATNAASSNAAMRMALDIRKDNEEKSKEPIALPEQYLKLIEDQGEKIQNETRAQIHQALEDSEETRRQATEIFEVITKVNIKTIVTANLTEMIRKIIPESGFEKFQTMLDLITTGLTTPEQVKNYLIKAQGIDISDTTSSADLNSGFKYLQQTFKNSIDFFKERVEAEDEVLDEDLAKCQNIDDIINIFLTASAQNTKFEERYKVKQACALLRIAAVFNFIERDGLGSARESAFNGISKILREHTGTRQDDRGKDKGQVFNKNGVYDSDEKDDIQISEFKCNKKDIFEMVAKLLHKEEARPTDILDQVRYRFVTQTAYEAFKLIRELFFESDSTFHWSMIRGAHSELKGLDDITLEAMEDPERAEEVFEKVVTEQVKGQRGNGSNGSSLKAFRSINIVHDVPIKLKDGTVILFPFECQIVSKKAFENNKEHAPDYEYKDVRKEEVHNRTMTNNIAEMKEAA